MSATRLDELRELLDCDPGDEVAAVRTLLGQREMLLSERSGLRSRLSELENIGGLLVFLKTHPALAAQVVPQTRILAPWVYTERASVHGEPSRAWAMPSYQSPGEIAAGKPRRWSWGVVHLEGHDTAEHGLADTQEEARIYADAAALRVGWVLA